MHILTIVMGVLLTWIGLCFVSLVMWIALHEIIRMKAHR